MSKTEEKKEGPSQEQVISWYKEQIELAEQKARSATLQWYTMRKFELCGLFKDLFLGLLIR